MSSESAPLIGNAPKRSNVRSVAVGVALLAVACVAAIAVVASSHGGPSVLLARKPAVQYVPKAAHINPTIKVAKGTQALAGCQDSTQSATIVPDEWVDEHNAYRREVGAPDLAWEDAIAVVAQKWADDLASKDCAHIEHSTHAWREAEYGSKLGENIAMAWGGSPPVKSGKSVTDMWTSEKADYSFGPSSDNCCANGAVVGHYTQVVWAKSQKLGCGQAQCASNGMTIWICMYDPPGNYYGQLPFQEAGVPTGMPKCPAAKIEGATGSAPPANEPAGDCGATGEECCSCDCGGGSGNAGAESPPPPPPASPPAPADGIGADGSNCADHAAYADCTASECCAPGLACLQAHPYFAMCLDPQISWSMCPKTTKYPFGWPNGQANEWTCTHVTPTTEDPCEEKAGTWCGPN